MDKPMNFEKWRDFYFLDTSHNLTYRDAFNAARQGLAGPPELKWEKRLNCWTAKIGNEEYDVFSKVWIAHSSGDLTTCQSREDGKDQAQAHLEKLWWEMSKPAEEEK